MKYSPKAVTFPIVLALALAGGSVFAEAPDANAISAEQIKAGMPAEVAKDGEKFANEGAVTEQVRQRTGEEKAQGEAVKARKELKEQEKQAQHKYQKGKSEGQGAGKGDTGSFGAFGGKGQGGGNGGGGGKR